jgi:hypothetical protein
MISFPFCAAICNLDVTFVNWMSAALQWQSGLESQGKVLV